MKMNMIQLRMCTKQFTKITKCANIYDSIVTISKLASKRINCAKNAMCAYGMSQSMDPSWLSKIVVILSVYSYYI